MVRLVAAGFGPMMLVSSYSCWLFLDVRIAAFAATMVCVQWVSFQSEGCHKFDRIHGANVCLPSVSMKQPAIGTSAGFEVTSNSVV